MKSTILKKCFIIFSFILVIQIEEVFGQFTYNKGLFYKNSSELTDSLSIDYSKLDVFYPLKRKDIPTIIFIHGGGLTTGERYIPEIFKKKNFIIVSPSYRLSPIFKCPTYIEDVAAAVAWTFKNIKEYGGNEKKIYLTGYSAGAYLAAMVLFDKKYLAKYDIDSDSLAGFFSYSGQMTTHFQVLKERGISEGSDTKYVDEFAPIYHVRNILPYNLFLTGDRNLDIQGRFSQHSLLINKLDSLNNKNSKYLELTGKNHESLLDTAMLITCNKIDSIEFERVKSSIEEHTPNNYKIQINNNFLKINSCENIDESNIYSSNGTLQIKSNQKEIQLDNLITGMYLIKSITNQRVYITKFLFQKYKN